MVVRGHTWFKGVIHGSDGSYMVLRGYAWFRGAYKD